MPLLVYVCVYVCMRAKKKKDDDTHDANSISGLREEHVFTFERRSVHLISKCGTGNRNLIFYMRKVHSGIVA